jgi:hypothetical protein
MTAIGGDASVLRLFTRRLFGSSPAKQISKPCKEVVERSRPLGELAANSHVTLELLHKLPIALFAVPDVLVNFLFNAVY